MLNSVNVTGRITAEPEVKSTQTGIAVCSFSLACDRDFKNKETGERETDFFDCVAWRHTAEFMGQYVRKGNQITLSGRLIAENYVDKEGNKRKSVKIQVSDVYLPPKSNVQSETAPPHTAQQQGAYQPPQNNGYVPPAPQQGYPPQGQQYAPQYAPAQSQSMPPPQNNGYNIPPQGQVTGNEEELPF